MHHKTLDKHSRKNSIIHKIDPRIKIVFTLLFLIFISLSKEKIYFIAIFSFIILTMSLTNISPLFYIKRIVICFPFLIFLFFLPIETALLLFARATASILTIITLMSTTKFTDFIDALKYFKVSKIFLMIFSFFYRYLFLFIDTANKMKLAVKSRSFSKKQRLNKGTVSNMIGCLFIRSYDQSERVYQAMLARGYNDTN